MKRMKKMTIKLINGTWCAIDTDPDVVKLMGTDTIQTPWRYPTPRDFVVAELARLNPGYTVV